MNKQAIHHITEAPYAYGVGEKSLCLKLRSAKDDLSSVVVYYKDRYNWEGEFETSSLNKVNTSDLFDYYETVVEVDEKRFRYFFEITDFEGNVSYMNERGILNKKPDIANTFQFPFLCKADLYDEVKWAQEGVVYQIFPDRFNNGDKNNDPKGIKPWGDKVTTETMFGGDLQGIIDKVDYISKLGVSILYMTPIFMSRSNHKYDTTNYYEVDPQFGDNEKLRELVKKCHDNDIKVVLDAVYNHSGSDFFAFEDLIEKGEKSRYKDWYFVDSYPVNTKEVNYVTFANKVSRMPKLNTSNSEVKNYLLKVSKYWIEEIGIDGWRLDVCDEVDHAFWRDFKKAVKESKDDAFIIGEIMHESNSFLKGDQLDSIMNYPFRECCLDFFARKAIDADELDHILAESRALYMNAVNRQLLNLIDSHDTARFLTDCDGDKDKMKLAIALQYTYVGIPYIYYGDEVGMEGKTDPDCRRCMIWDEKEQDLDMLDHYKSLAEVRKKSKALVYGDYTNVCKDGMALGFTRKYEDEEVLVLINNGTEAYEYSLGYQGSFNNLYEGKEEAIDKKIVLEPMSFKILKIK
ncbi:glycoside hydrolase family 13 protein [Clostridium sp. C8-1-8]|uniref:glycoside hydrolase family 13 protein n=1 Tax=Clostridium sp. C8-1-8 TaxID=2698831 RepID=UPI00136D6FF5|nr:glycoside hydrolase family 13 protein [Clostridium sp. C8-1-8]